MDAFTISEAYFWTRVIAQNKVEHGKLSFAKGYPHEQFHYATMVRNAMLANRETWGSFAQSLPAGLEDEATNVQNHWGWTESTHIQVVLHALLTQPYKINDDFRQSGGAAASLLMKFVGDLYRGVANAELMHALHPSVCVLCHDPDCSCEKSTSGGSSSSDDDAGEEEDSGHAEDDAAVLSVLLADEEADKPARRVAPSGHTGNDDA